MNISPRYTNKQWEVAFNGGEDWNNAIDIVEDRIRGRWLDAGDLLVGESHSGFAILALDCIVLESLWGFMNGKAVPQRHAQLVYRDILTGPRFGWTAGQSEAFRKFVRNGVIHDAETRRGWLVGKTTPSSVTPQRDKAGGYKLNRTKFHYALKGTFEDWIARLRADHPGVRAKMRDRMNQIIAQHAP